MANVEVLIGPSPAFLILRVERGTTEERTHIYDLEAVLRFASEAAVAAGRILQDRIEEALALGLVVEPLEEEE
jgi:hypothetical protein